MAALTAADGVGARGNGWGEEAAGDERAWLGVGGSVSADCSGMAASRFPAAAATCGILLCFAVESHKL